MRHLRVPRDAPTRSIARPLAPPWPARIVVVKGENEEASIVLTQGSCVLGAGAGADLLLDDETASRAHAKLTLTPRGVLIEDLGSRNGTFYLGQRIQSIEVGLGVAITVGRTNVRVEAGAPPVGTPDHESSSYGELRSGSRAMHGVFSTLRRLEGSLANVLVGGESGTGKELVARAIHDHSQVASGPLIAVNCGALQASLVRSELFGHKRGAFTGAISDHRGAFQAANGGTLFLDEIGDLPEDVQPMLLRALEERKVTPVGSNQALPVQVRVIAGTHKNLEDGVSEGSFRRDLFYRLSVVRIDLPALRERKEDIPILARLFAEGASGGEIPADVMAMLEKHAWPGNVRELRHAIESFFAVGQLPRVSEVPPARSDDSNSPFVLGPIDLTRSYQAQKEALVERFTQAYLEQLFEQCRFNVTEAARISGLERSYLSKLAARFGVKGKKP